MGFTRFLFRIVMYTKNWLMRYINEHYIYVKSGNSKENLLLFFWYKKRASTTRIACRGTRLSTGGKKDAASTREKKLQKKKSLNYADCASRLSTGRGDRIRTCGFHVPNVALYQTEPHLVILSCYCILNCYINLSAPLVAYSCGAPRLDTLFNHCAPPYYIILRAKCQGIFKVKMAPIDKKYLCYYNGYS